MRPGTPPRLLLPRLIAGVPLLGIGLAHVFLADAPMRPLVEAAGFPVPALAAPLGVAAEIVAGLLLVLGLRVRIGALLAIPTMLGAIWAHLAIDVWPNPSEPPLALPIAVLAAAAYVVWRGGPAPVPDGEPVPVVVEHGSG